MEIPEYLREQQLNQTEEDTRATFFHTAVMRVCYGRRYFLTTGGYMGIGPAAMKVDDVVCVARGASVPLILRERRTFVGDGVIQAFNAHYERRLVGEAHRVQSKTLWDDVIGDIDMHRHRMQSKTLRYPAIGAVDRYVYGVHAMTPPGPVISDVDIYGHHNHTTTRDRDAVDAEDAYQPHYHGDRRGDHLSP